MSHYFQPCNIVLFRETLLTVDDTLTNESTQQVGQEFSYLMNTGSVILQQIGSI